MATRDYIKPLTRWGAIIAIIVGLIEVIFYGASLALALPWIAWLGPFWIYSIGSTIGWIIMAIIAIICGFITLRRYVPLLDGDPRAVAIPLIILGILCWAAIGEILIFIAAILAFFEKEIDKA